MRRIPLELLSVLIPVAGSLWGLLNKIRDYGDHGLTARKAFRLVVHRWSGRGEVRMSASVLLRVRAPWNDNEYLLIRGGSDDHPYWGPIGGVLKFFPSRVETRFNEYRVERHRSAELGSDLVDDIRLVLPSRNILKFLRWFRTDQGRESIDQAMFREMVEELGPGSGIEDESSQALGIELLRLLPKLGLEESYPRPFVEIGNGPVLTGGDAHYFQVRYFYVVEVVQQNDFAEWLSRALSVYLGQRCCWVTSSEIRGADGPDGIPIGGHSRSLLGDPPSVPGHKRG